MVFVVFPLFLKEVAVLKERVVLVDVPGSQIVKYYGDGRVLRRSILVRQGPLGNFVPQYAPHLYDCTFLTSKS